MYLVRTLYDSCTFRYGFNFFHLALNYPSGGGWGLGVSKTSLVFFFFVAQQTVVIEHSSVVLNVVVLKIHCIQCHTNSKCGSSHLKFWLMSEYESLFGNNMDMSL